MANTEKEDKEKQIEEALGKKLPPPPPEETEEEVKEEPGFGVPVSDEETSEEEVPLEAPKQGRGMKARVESVKETAQKTAETAKKAAKAARKTVQLARALYSAVSSLAALVGSWWILAIIIVVILAVLIITFIFIGKANVGSPGSHFMPASDPVSQANITKLKEMHPNFEFNKPNNLARLVMPKEDWQAIENGRIDARTINFLTALAEKCDHLKVSLRKGHDTEETKWSDESEPGSKRTISAHYTGQAIDVYECGLMYENGWKKLKTVGIAEQRVNQDLSKEVLSEISAKLEDLLKEYKSGSMDAKKIEEELAKWRKVIERTQTEREKIQEYLSQLNAWIQIFQSKSTKNATSLDNLSQGFYTLANLLNTLQNIPNILPREPVDSCLNQLPQEVMLLNSFMPASDSLNEILKYNCPREMLDNISFGSDRGINAIFETLSEIANFYYSVASDYRYQPEAQTQTLESFQKLTPALQAFLQVLEKAQSGSENGKEILEGIAISLSNLSGKSLEEVTYLNELSKEYHGPLYEILSSLQDLEDLDNLNQLTTTFNQTLERLRQRQVFPYLEGDVQQDLNLLLEQSAELKKTVLALASLDNLEILNDYPYELGFNSRDFKPLSNLEHLKNLYVLGSLAKFEIPGYVGHPEKVEEINRNISEALSYLKYLGSLANLKVIDEKIGLSETDCYLSETTACGTGGLEELSNLELLTSDPALKNNLQKLAINLSYLSELKIYSDPVLAARVEKGVNLADFDINNPKSYQILQNLFAKDTENSLDEEISKLKSEIRDLFSEAGITLPENFDLFALKSAFNKGAQEALKQEVLTELGINLDEKQKEVLELLQQEIGRPVPSSFNLEEIVSLLKEETKRKLISELGLEWDFNLTPEGKKELLYKTVQKITEREFPLLARDKLVGIAQDIPLKGSQKELTTLLVSEILAEKESLGPEINSGIVKEAFISELRQKLGMDIPVELDSVDFELLKRLYESKIRERMARLARKNPWVRKYDDYLTRVAPYKIYKPRALRTVRGLVEFALSLPENERPRQILATIKLGEFNPLNPNYGSMLSSIYTKVHFGF